MSCSERNRFPFTVSQWQELEHQALVFKYMVSGIPIPPDLIFTVRTSLDSSLSSKLLLHQPHQLGWNGFDMGGFGMRKIDPEPGRCRRTDGKKWRCSKDAYPDSKYCERHMHRGRNRSRKPVEILSPSSSPTIPITKNTLSSPSEPRFLYNPNFSSTGPPGLIGENKFSNDYTHSPDKAYRKRHGDEIKGETDHEHTSFSVNDSSSWQLDFSVSQLKDNKANYSSSGLENGRHQNHEHHHYYNIERDNDKPKKVMHHFLDEWSPKDKSDSWPVNSQDNFSINNRNNTQLSMSVPSSLHDFFMTQK